MVYIHTYVLVIGKTLIFAYFGFSQAKENQWTQICNFPGFFLFLFSLGFFSDFYFLMDELCCTFLRFVADFSSIWFVKLSPETSQQQLCQSKMIKFFYTLLCTCFLLFFLHMSELVRECLCVCMCICFPRPSKIKNQMPADVITQHNK